MDQLGLGDGVPSAFDLRGILGNFRCTASGDTTSTPITIRAQRGGGLRVIAGDEGAAIDRVLEPAPRLFR